MIDFLVKDSQTKNTLIEIAKGSLSDQSRG